MRSIRANRALLVLGLLLIAQVRAQESDGQALDFFDYLGSLVAHDGDWVDPLAMAEGETEDDSLEESGVKTTPGNDEMTTESQQ